ncbi:MAG: flagellar export protein FliJ [Lachnospiraceae bacterium]|nr:flagellar export protein FliJ [Lachnospiraceae bacterium]
MPKFNYRMQGILNVKVKMEDQAKTEYSFAQMRYNEEEEKLQALILRRVGYEQRARQLRADGQKLVPLEMEEMRRAVESMKVLIRAQMMELKRAEKDLNAARFKLQEAMQERKMHEKLREKALDAFKEELAYEESKEIDGLVSYTYGAGS